MMGGKKEHEEGGASTLSLSMLLRHKRPAEPPGLVTPPLQTMASVPFQWEEAPGRPRPMSSTSSPFRPKSARCLELPPRMLAEGKVTNMPSPITVLDGPYMGRALSCCTTEIGLSDGKKVNSEKGPFGSCSWRWSGGGTRENREVGEGKFDFSPSQEQHGGDVKVKMTRFGRKGSLLSLTHASSYLLVSPLYNFLY
ncbi:hypothetical protein Ancab_009066 [Ancistrocladus abbreviatus]